MLEDASEYLDLFYSQLVIEELIRNGLDHFFICPGSRSTPLTIAVAKNTKAKSFICIDERGAGFAATGYANASHKAAVVITTSGSAVANLLPAVVEADAAKIPLVLLCADRPIELHQVSANQTINQTGIFSNFLRFETSFPAVDSQVNFSFLLSTIDTAFKYAHQAGDNGPVHLNFAFREPFFSQEVDARNISTRLSGWMSHAKPYSYLPVAKRVVTLQELESLITSINSAKNSAKCGLIIVSGKRTHAEKKAISLLAESLHWPLVADISAAAIDSKNLLHYFDLSLLSEAGDDIEIVIHFGSRLISKRINEYIESRINVVVSDSIERTDINHNVEQQICTNIEEVALLLAENTSATKSNTTQKLIDVDKKIAYLISQTTLLPFEAMIILKATAFFKNTVYLSNSMPVRDADMFLQKNLVNTLTNRGASGIDGLIASAIGASIALHARLTLCIGDLSFLHDMNSLSLLHHLPVGIDIIVINNNGGGIFSFLEIHKTEPKYFDKFFAAEHNFSFESIAKQFNMKYLKIESQEQLELFKTANNFQDSYLIECMSNRQENYQAHTNLYEKIKELI